MAEGLGERLTQLEQAVRRAGELISRLKAERAALEKELNDLRVRAGASEQERGELARLRQERKEVLAQVETILRELDKLEGA
jgi:ABC-type transporter Mla subunit MlaD